MHECVGIECLVTTCLCAADYVQRLLDTRAKQNFFSKKIF